MKNGIGTLVFLVVVFIALILGAGDIRDDLFVAFISSILGGLFTLIGVKITLESSHRQNYSSFYLRFNKSQVYMDRFIKKSTCISKALSGTDRRLFRHKYFAGDFEDMKVNIEATIKSLNRDFTEVDYDNFLEDYLDINENSPLDFYYDINFMLLLMVSIHNSLIGDSKYLVSHKFAPISSSYLSVINLNIPHEKQINLLTKRYNKVKRRLKIR